MMNGSRPVPRAILLDGPDVYLDRGAVLPAPAMAPAPLVLTRLLARLGDGGLVLISGREQPSWSYLTAGGEGWTITGGPAWYTARCGNELLRIGRLAEADPLNDPLLDDNCVTTVMRHRMFADLTGVSFYGDGGTVAAVLMDRVINVRGAPPLRRWASTDAPKVNEPAWCGSWELPRPYSAQLTLDRNAQYLSGANDAFLPLDEPDHTGAIRFDGTRVGLWLITVPDNPESRLPHPCGARARPGSRAWCAQPTMGLLDWLGCKLEVHDSWTGSRDRSRRAMKRWYDVLRDARAALIDATDPDSLAVLRAVKDTYSRGVDHLAKDPRRRWYRPDWTAILRAQVRTGMWRAMWQAGHIHDLWPCSTSTDSVSYEHPDPAPSYHLGTGMGQWKVTTDA
jgi:hypothetical protein